MGGFKKKGEKEYRTDQMLALVTVGFVDGLVKEVVQKYITEK